MFIDFQVINLSRAVAEQSAATSFSRPVVLYFKGGPVAASIEEAILRDSVPAPVLRPKTDDTSLMLLVNGVDACRLLREYAGAGGDYLATEFETANIDFHSVFLCKDRMMVKMYHRNMEVDCMQLKYNVGDELDASVWVDAPGFGFNVEAINVNDLEDEVDEDEVDEDDLDFDELDDLDFDELDDEDEVEDEDEDDLDDDEDKSSAD